MGAKINNFRPQGVPPIPKNIISKYGDKITSVWWHAKGRDEDPVIGVEINGVRKTYSGYVWNGWWYFLKAVHPPKEEGGIPQCYWYRKRKVPDSKNPKEFRIEEEYVGIDLRDPETGVRIEIPPELKHDYTELCKKK